MPTPVVSFDEYEASTNLGALDMFVEETFEKDGDIEEVFAYDNQELSTEDISQATEVDSEKKFHVPRRKKKGYPPVTPFACTRDTTFGNMLLTCWPEVSLIIILKVRFLVRLSLSVKIFTIRMYYPIEIIHK